MATKPMNRVIQHLLATCGREGMTDGELLTRFLSGRDDAALAALVGRHGPMVWGVCCRLLRGHHDAEDAFQATFLVLAQKAVTLPNRERVGNWLYGVAHQTAVRMRASAAKRGLRERQVVVMPEPTTAEQYVWNDLSPVLDEELSRLPDKYRVLIVLCDLEGVTRKEVARRLDLPEGTAASRLAAARAMLAKRLTRRGIVVSGGLMGAVLSQQASAAVSPLVLSSTIKAVTLVAGGQAAATGGVSVTVATLTEGVLKAMLMSKLKSAAAVLLVVLVCIGGGVAVTPMVMGKQPNSPKKSDDKKRAMDNKKQAEAKEAALKDAVAWEIKKLEGSWQVQSQTYQGNPFDDSKPNEFVFSGNTLTIKTRGQDDAKMTFTIDPAKKPKTMDVKPEKEPEPGTKVVNGELIYELNGDTLKICVGFPRPKELTDKDQPLIILKRKSLILKDDQKKEQMGKQPNSPKKSGTSRPAR